MISPPTIQPTTSTGATQDEAGDDMTAMPGTKKKHTSNIRGIADKITSLLKVDDASGRWSRGRSELSIHAWALAAP